MSMVTVFVLPILSIDAVSYFLCLSTFQIAWPSNFHSVFMRSPLTKGVQKLYVCLLRLSRSTRRRLVKAPKLYLTCLVFCNHVQKRIIMLEVWLRSCHYWSGSLTGMSLLVLKKTVSVKNWQFCNIVASKRVVASRDGALRGNHSIEEDI